jgi:hypothetical protein
MSTCNEWKAENCQKNKTILIATRTRRDIRDYQEQAQFNPW